MGVLMVLLFSVLADLKTDRIPNALTAAGMAAAVIGIIPILIIYPFFQDYFVKGITMGAVKG